MIGELGLDGRVRPVRGILPAVLAAADAGYGQVVVPERAAAEASLVPGVSVLGVRSLRQLIAVLTDEPVPDEEPDEHGPPRPAAGGPADAGHRRGHGHAQHGRRALRPRPRPGRRRRASTRRARRWRSPRPAATTCSWRARPAPARPCSPSGCPRLLPPAHPAGVPGGHRRALGRRGCCRRASPWSRRPPYCAPHHSATMQALVGGGTGLATPRRRLAGPPRRALSGRDPGVRQPGPGRPAPAAGGGSRGDRAQLRGWCGCRPGS